ncbi:aspartyl protease family protein [Pedobacter sp. Du54]|uniref:aspartyl protease family protein n=1 Tax=Pedobacter anseongensis TaxID=3133439 RepID=UPI0030950A49
MNGRSCVIKSTFITSFVILITLQFCRVTDGYAQKFQFGYSIKRDAISFYMVKNLVIIPLFINDKGPYNFILDTGVDPLIITDSSIVDQSQLANLRRVKINGAGEGDEITAYVSQKLSVKVGAAYMDHIPTVILKEDIFNLSSFLGMKIHGLIGYHFFNSFIVKINYNQRKVYFSLPETRKKNKWDKLDLEFFNNKPYINVDLNVQDLGKINAKLVIDCGASHALSLEAYKEAPFPLPTPTFQANLGVGLGGKINGNIGRINSIQLGKFYLENVITSFPDFNDVAVKARQKQRTGNLGADILKRFTVIFDYQENAMYLKKNSHYKEAFEHDMSGMEVFVDDKIFNRVLVSRVEPASPAERAGILPNDEILSINFLRTNEYTLDNITNLLKSENGKTILIEFSRNGRVYVKLLALKRRL